MLKIIAAVADNEVIGQGLEIPWPRLPDDMKWFKKHTLDQIVVMGRKTWDSLPDRFKPLPDRLNVILTRGEPQSNMQLVLDNWDDVLDLTNGDKDVWIIGGGEIYALALQDAEEMYLTRVHMEPKGDILFPKWHEIEWRLYTSEPHAIDERHPCSFTWEVYKRIA